MKRSPASAAARVGLVARGDVGDDAADEHAAVRACGGAGAVPEQARDAVETGDPVGDVGVLAREQAVVEAHVVRASRRRGPATPRVRLAPRRGHGAAEEALDHRARGEVT